MNRYKFLFQIIFVLGITSLSYSQAKKINNAIKNKDYKKAILLGEKSLKSNPNDFNTLLSLGIANNMLSESKKAIDYLERAKQLSKRDWQHSWVNIELMKAYFADGQKEKSINHYIRALSYKGTNNSKEELNSLKLLFGFDEFYNDWDIVETEHFIFYFQKGVKISNKKKYMNAREQAFKNINEFFSAKLPKRIDFFVWKSNDEAVQVLNKSLGFTVPEYAVSHNRSNQSKGHEIAHNLSFLYNKTGKKTRFINEGISVYFDQTRSNRLKKAQESIGIKHNVDVKLFWTRGENYPEKTLYPIAGAFVESLITYDKNKFMELCKNQTYENAKLIYGDESLEKLILDFNKAVNSK